MFSFLCRRSQISQLQQQLAKAMSTIADLQTEVATLKTTVANAVTLLGTLSAEVAASKADQATVDQLNADVKGMQDSLSAAVAANTPQA